MKTWVQSGSVSFGMSRLVAITPAFGDTASRHWTSPGTTLKTVADENLGALKVECSPKILQRRTPKTVGSSARSHHLSGSEHSSHLLSSDLAGSAESLKNVFE